MGKRINPQRIAKGMIAGDANESASKVATEERSGLGSRRTRETKKKNG